ncbi:cupin domain-containing protein [Paenibacillus silvisoli]|uniref:cupin domain-containing protein n=1 Tax=Paenibacillus silvisoli TaxID=3110539 RepID=UPI003899032E
MKTGQMEKINLFDATRNMSTYTNFVVSEVNDHVLRAAVIDGEFHWHQHEDCDELFLVIEGELIIDLEDQVIELKQGEAFTVPQGVMHRTRSNGRTVNLCFEKKENVIIGN